MKKLLLCVVGVLILQIGHCQFPELLNFEDGFINAIDNVVRKYNTCTASAEQLDGLCMHSLECYSRNGVSYQRAGCSFGKTCCVFDYGCVGRRVRERVTYFSVLQGTATTSTCTLNVLPVNENVCQYRLDFLLFSLQNPVAGVCTTESLEIAPSPHQVPPLCGNLDGQHFYVHTDAVSGLSLNVRTTGMANSHWKIKVTQIECPGRRNVLQKSQADSAFSALLAPTGCTQYYTERTGLVQSLGFTSQTYLTNQHYSICFRRSTNDRISFMFNALLWPAATCVTGTAANAYDVYLYFPPEFSAPTGTAGAQQISASGYVCGFATTVTLPAAASSFTTGPFVIVVKGLRMPLPAANTVLGFSFTYAL